MAGKRTPLSAAMDCARGIHTSSARFRKWLRRSVKPASALGSNGIVTTDFGYSRGTPIDRYYIDRFIREFGSRIAGDVLEFGDDQYSRQYAGSIRRSVVLGGPVRGVECYQADLTQPTTYAGIGTFDCIIATQVLNFIFDIHSAVDGIWSLLKPGGCALISVASYCQVSVHDATRWGDYWRLSPQAIAKLLEGRFSSVTIRPHGNLTAAIGMLRGLCAEDLSKTDLDTEDTPYPIVIAALAEK
jgi:SAM-dependent methyltransferase